MIGPKKYQRIARMYDRTGSEHEMYPYKNRPFPTFLPEFRPFVDALIQSYGKLYQTVYSHISLVFANKYFVTVSMKIQSVVVSESIWLCGIPHKVSALACPLKWEGCRNGPGIS